MKLRLTIGILAVLLMLPAAAVAQDEAYTLGDLEQRCEDNSLGNAEFQDACLAILYLFLIPEAGKTPPDLSGVSAASSGDIPGTGMYIVGTDIAPGTYRTAGPEGDYPCYWERLSGFSGELGDIIANGGENGPAIVTISRSDEAFTTKRCQPWTKVEG